MYNNLQRRGLYSDWWHIYRKKYLTFEAEENQTFSILLLEDLSTTDVPYIEYSVNGGSWLRVTNVAGTLVLLDISLSTKDTVRLRGDILQTSSLNKAIASTGADTKYFLGFASGLVKVYGNILSLYYLDNFADKNLFKLSPDSLNYYGSARDLFNSIDYLSPSYNRVIKITDASKLIIPLYELHVNDCLSLFLNLKELVKAPYLYPKILGDSSLEAIFTGCKKLQKVHLGATLKTATSLLNWLLSGAASGTIYAKYVTLDSDSDSGIPSGWSLVKN